MNLWALLMIIGGSASLLAVAVSWVWQWLDAAADGTIDKVNANAVASAASGYRHVEISQAEAIAKRYKRAAKWVRRLGLFLLYGGMAVLALSFILWGISELDSRVPLCR